jgi:hypothetical protein
MALSSQLAAEIRLIRAAAIASAERAASGSARRTATTAELSMITPASQPSIG